MPKLGSTGDLKRASWLLQVSSIFHRASTTSGDLFVNSVSNKVFQFDGNTIFALPK